MSRENGLSHRGLMKMANAKLDYLLEMDRVGKFIQKNGETEEIIHYSALADEKYKQRVQQIYAEDKTLNLN